MSIHAQRKAQRQQNLAGRARSAHRLPQSLEQSIIQESTTVPALNASPSHTLPLPSCKRGCPQVLSGLKAAFDAAGLHPAKDHQKRVASYPVPKNQKLAHRNIRGKMIIIKKLIIAEKFNNHLCTRTHTHTQTHTYTHTHTHTHKHKHTYTHTHTHTTPLPPGNIQHKTNGLGKTPWTSTEISSVEIALPPALSFMALEFNTSERSSVV